MRALIDQNLPARFAERMVEAGHDAVHAEVLGLARARDPEIFAACRDQGRVLVTYDKKLTKFLAETKAASPSVLIIRNAPRPTAAIELVLASAGLVEQTIAAKGQAVFSIAPERPIRVELLPLGSVN